MIKFLHLADIHLGLQLNQVAFSMEIAEERRRALWETFEKTVNYAAKNSYEFLFIAGDLYEEDYFSLGDIKRVRDILARAKDVNILITAGNHDYLHKGSRYNQIQWSKNVHIFDSGAINKIEFEHLDTAIFGYSWDSLEIRDDRLFDDIDLQTELGNKIMILHADAIMDSNYLPVDIDRLKKLDMDYIALGHIHKPELLEENIAYPGCLEPTNFGETGKRGYILGELGEELKLEFIDASKKKFINKQIYIDENMSYMNILDLFLAEESKNKDFYRITLEGYIQNDIEKTDLFSEIKSNYYYLEIVDKSTPDYDLLSLEKNHEDGIIGEYIKLMKGSNLQDEIVKDALYYGLDSLLKEGMKK